MSIAIVTSVVLSALIGVVSNALVGSWGWALVTALLVLVSCMACVQLFLHRAAGREQPTTSGESGKHESPAHVGRPADPRNPATMTFTSSTVRHSMIAGRDINQTKIGTGGILGIVGVALLLGVGTTALGRTPAAVPKRAVNQTLTPTTDNRAQNSGPGPGGVTANSPVPTSGATYYTDSAVLVGNGRDLDPKDGTRGLADVAFTSKAGQGGLSLFNGAAVAVMRDGAAPTADTCRNVAGYSSAPISMPIDTTVVRCLRTSDGRYGSLSITHAESNALGGSANITWTIWP